MIIGNFNAYVLAGGSSRRMGVDKLFVQINGLSMLERAIATCKKCFNQVKLVSPQTDKLLSYDCPVIIDNPKAKGPMAGVIAALEDCDTDICFITAVDLPDLSVEIIESLIANYQNQQYLGLLETNGPQPLCGIYHKSSLEVLYRMAHNNDYRMTEALTSLNYGGIVVREKRWRNINCPEDLPNGVTNG
jgi:molybdopterin-guanine dinucleotide biosynthesis protein A